MKKVILIGLAIGGAVWIFWPGNHIRKRLGTIPLIAAWLIPGIPPPGPFGTHISI